MNWADVLVFIFSILIILTVATQQAQDSVQDAFSGEKSDLFKDQKTRGFELFLMRSAFVFLACVRGICICFSLSS